MTGRPSFIPTNEQRHQVRVMTGLDVPQEAIASYLGIDPKTLRKTCRRELDDGTLAAKHTVAPTFFRMATREGTATAAIVWPKAHRDHCENNAVEVNDNPRLGARSCISSHKTGPVGAQGMGEEVAECAGP